MKFIKMHWIKEHQKKIICAVVILAVLLFAFWYGNGSEASRGFAIGSATETAEVGGELTTQGQTVTDSQTKSENEDSKVSEGSAQASQQASEENQNANGQESQISAGQEGQNEGEAGSQNNVEAGQNTETEGQVDPQNQQPSQNGSLEDSSVFSCTISISCETILGNMDQLKEEKKSVVPADGWILRPVTIEVTKGETVFTVLQRVCREYKIHMESTGMAGTAYVEGIHNLYQFDCGRLSGWVYKVNGMTAGVGAAGYELHSDDVITWQYTCQLGQDL